MIRSIRVLHLIVYPQRMAGANRSLFELISNYPSYVEPRVVLTAEGPVADVYRKLGVPVTVLNSGPRLSGSFGGVALSWGVGEKARALVSEFVPFVFRLADLARSEQIDLFHANDPRGTILAGPVAHLLRRPLVAHMRSERSFDGAAWRAFEAFPDRIITVSDAISAGLGPQGRRKAVTIYNGTRDVDLEGPTVPWLQALRDRGVTLVAAFASTVPFKGCHHLMQALALLNERGWRKKIAVLWVGDLPPEHASYQEWLFTKKSALALDNFTFAGWQADPFPFYRSVDLCVLPSVSREILDLGGALIEVRGAEGLPRTHIEAMCHGLAVVGTQIAGVPELVGDGCGLMVAPSDPAALAEGIEKLVLDASLRQQMGARGRARVLERFSTRVHVRNVLRVYDELLERSGQSVAWAQ